MSRLIKFLPFSFIIFLSACSLLSPSPTGQIATPSSGTLSPAAELRFSVQAPPGTEGNAELTFVLLDPVTDLNLNAQRIPMEAQSDGRWSITLTPAVGSLLYYRYEKSSPTEAIEVTSQGSPVDYRTTHIAGPGEIHEVIARWSGEPFQGTSGRILGQIVSASDDQPINEMLVSAGGHSTFTDGEGRFRLDDLPVGLHTLTAFSPTGSYLPQRQEALIAANTTTPARLQLQPAQPVVVTFQVTVPADTPEQSTLRLAGNVSQLGFRFKPSEYGSYQSISQMPALVRVDPEHYLGVFTLYEGTYLHYKYTLGDGVWNAERSAMGAFASRSVTLEDDNATMRDRVASWSDGSTAPTRFEIAVPETTPPGDQVVIQFKAGSWRNPLPMWPQGNLWTFALYGPGSLQQELEYRFCRNMQCGVADEEGFAGHDASGRELAADQIGTLIQDVITDWQWLDRVVLEQEYPSDPQPFEHLSSGGYEFSSTYDPSWLKYVPAALISIDESGANEIVLSPAWSWAQNNPFPVLEMDPTTAPLEHELKEMVKLGRDRGLRVTLRPSFHTGGVDSDSWWQQALRNQLWWELWFEEYRSFILTYADWAQKNSVEKLIIGGPEVIPALPFGSLPDGSPSGVPADSELRWRNLITEVRQRFAGQLAFELEFRDELSLVPPHIDMFDQAHIYWHSPIAQGDPTPPDVQLATIEAQLNQVTSLDVFDEMPITISLAYLSIENSTAACPPQPDGTCRPLSSFSQGQIVDIDLVKDLEEQARIYSAFLQAIADESQIVGLFARGFYPPVILHDKSLSVYGKPAQDVLTAWFRDLPGSE